ncbi:MAG TPA: DinB family protein [Methylomirabilota bacterium]|jgi:hypothetical protein|nr:DinB family protein [Methylomirabilota bacterium]
MDDEERRIRSYLQAQAAKLSPAQIVDKVRAAMEQLRVAAAAVPPARFGERPEAGEWSGNEVMAHVLDAGARFGGEIVHVLDGRHDAPARDAAAVREAAPHPPTRRSAEEWSALLARDRGALFARVLAADPGARLDAPIDHGMFGTLNWRETLLFLRLHDLDHAGQLQKIAAALGGGEGPPAAI